MTPVPSPRPNAERTPAMWRSFTGLIPLLLSIPLLLFQAWAVGIAVGITSSLVVLAYHFTRGQGITSLDIMTLAFGMLNAVLYFGFHSAFLVRHLDVLIYTLLFAQVVIAQLRGQPWTIQYAKRTVPREAWDTRAFREANRFVSLLWGATFLVCALIALLAPAASVRLWVPIALLVLLAVATPRLARWYGTRQRAA